MHELLVINSEAYGLAEGEATDPHPLHMALNASPQIIAAFHEADAAASLYDEILEEVGAALQK